MAAVRPAKSAWLSICLLGTALSSTACSLSGDVAPFPAPAPATWSSIETQAPQVGLGLSRCLTDHGVLRGEQPSNADEKAGDSAVRACISEASPPAP